MSGGKPPALRKLAKGGIITKKNYRKYLLIQKAERAVNEAGRTF